MIYEKELRAPVFRRRTVRRALSLFRDENNAIFANGLHFRETDRGLCCAEGADVKGELTTDDVLITAEGHALTRFICRGGALLAGEKTYPFTAVPHTILAYVPPEAEILYFALTEEGCYLLSANSEARRVFDGAACGCVYGERLFFADGQTLRWTKPLSPTETEIALRGAGNVELPSFAGDIHTLVSFGGKVYAFRERGITCITAPGDELSFRAEEVLFAGGKIFAGTVRSCGGEVLFLTENGLYALGEGRCTRLSGCGDALLDLSGTVTATAGGKYYATARFMGERCIWCVEPDVRRGHLIRMRAEQLAGGQELAFAEEGKLLALSSERGLPAMRRCECVLRTEQSFLGLSSRNKFLDGITVEGEGNFRVEAKGEYGLPRAVCGRAGERMRFPLPVRGTGFSLDIRTIEEDACIRGLVFDLREEVAKW